MARIGVGGGPRKQPMLSVALTYAARDDLDALLAFVHAHSPVAAEHVRERLLEALASLSEFPARFPVAEESDAWGREVRSMIVYRYRVLYQVLSTEVRVLRIVHGRMQRPAERPH
jgi:plasmid stabilization system protein ParE